MFILMMPVLYYFLYGRKERAEKKEAKASASG
jgi:preprotein translocase subunit YajC